MLNAQGIRVQAAKPETLNPKGKQILALKIDS